jgi:uncharacterized membrane protein
MSRSPTAALVFAAVLSIGACGHHDDAPPPDPDRLDVLDRSYTLTRLEDLALYSTAAGINSKGTVVGTRACGGTPCGYVRTGSATLSTPLPYSALTGIDDAGFAAGYGGDCRFNGIATGTGSFRFDIAGGAAQPVVVPGSVDDPPLASYCAPRNTTAVRGVGPGGDLLGTYRAADGSNPGFVMTAGVARDVVVPGTSTTEVHGSDSAGRLVGWSQTAAGVRTGFLLENGRFSPIAYPGATLTEARGIAADGTIVGSFVDAEGRRHGFVLRAGKFAQFDVPDASSTQANAINASGSIVGDYQRTEGDGTRTAGFVLVPR